MPNTAITNSFSPNTKTKSAQVNTNFTNTITHTGFRAYLSPSQTSLANASWITVTINNENYDIGSNFNIGTYTFTAPVDGYYFLYGKIGYVNGTVSDGRVIRARLLKNGATELAVSQAHTGSASLLSVNVTDVAYLTATETVILQTFHSQGTATPDLYGTTEDTYFTGYFLGI